MPLARERTCKACSRRFADETKSQNARYCSDGCRPRPRRVTRSCVKCGKPTPGKGPRKYCSEECGLVTLKCGTCGDLFGVDFTRRATARFCSEACRDRRHRSELVACTCRECGEGFSVKEWQIRQGRGSFCSRRCSMAGRRFGGKPSKIASRATQLFLADCPVLAVPEMRVGRWSIDLALPLINVAVELDGTYWHSRPEVVERDRRKDAWLLSHGWTVIRIPMDGRSTPESVAARMKEALGL